MRRNYFVLSSFLLFYPLVSQSQSLDSILPPLPEPRSSYYQVEAGGGWLLSREYKRKTILSAPVTPDRLVQLSQTQPVPFHLGISKTFVLSPYSVVNIGPHFYYHRIHESGEVISYATPLLLNKYPYRFSSQTADFLLEGRWQFEALNGQSIHPYLFAGIGFGSTKSSYSARFNMPSSFFHLAVDVGAGIDIDVSDKFSAGVKYLYFYNGRNSPDTTQVGPIEFNPVYQRLDARVSYVLINLTYKFMKQES